MLSTLIVVQTFLTMSCVAGVGYADQAMERGFFDQPPETRLERLKQYSLEDQYKIFRYGNDVVHPPTTNLAIPIAERGIAAMPFLKAKLQQENDDTSLRDILRILDEMVWRKAYDVKSDDGLIRYLTARIGAMKHRDWQPILERMLRIITRA
jgi:hypothetical protein